MRTRRLLTYLSLLLSYHTTVTVATPVLTTTSLSDTNPVPLPKRFLTPRSVVNRHTCPPDQANLIYVALEGVAQWSTVAISVARNERTSNIYYNIQRRITFNHWFETHAPQEMRFVGTQFSRLKSEVDRGDRGRVSISCDNTPELRYCEGDANRWSRRDNQENTLWLCPAWFTAHRHRLDQGPESSRAGHLLEALLNMRVINLGELHENDSLGRLRSVHRYEEFAHNIWWLHDQFERSGEGNPPTPR